MEASQRPPPLISFRSVRLRIGVLLLAALCIEGLMRSNLNMAMVCMVNRTAIAELEKGGTVNYFNFSEANTMTSISKSNKTGFIDEDSCDVIPKKVEKSYSGRLVWTTKQQGWIFASYYAGTLLIVVPGTYLIDCLGATIVVQIGAIVNVVGTLLTPLISQYLGAYALLFTRFLMGAGQGILVPCTSVLIAHWFPPEEKSFAVGISTAGNQLSIIIAMVFTAGLCQVPILDGWPTAFYLHGLIGVMLCTLWCMYVKDVPTRYEDISDAELRYITGGIGERGQKRVSPDAPWKVILSSCSVWATAMSSFSQSFATVGMVTYIPLYYRTVLRMDLTANGILSAAPFVSQLLSKVVFVYFATIAGKHGFGLTAVTKTCNLIGALGTAVCYICLLFLDCHKKWAAVFMVCMAMAILSGYVPGYQTGIVSIAPKYTSAIASFCRLLANIASVLSPSLIGWIAKKGLLAEWRIVFILMAVTLTLTGIFYQICGSADVQSWAVDTSKDGIGVELVEKAPKTS